MTTECPRKTLFIRQNYAMKCSIYKCSTNTFPKVSRYEKHLDQRLATGFLNMYKNEQNVYVSLLYRKTIFTNILVKCCSV